MHVRYGAHSIDLIYANAVISLSLVEFRSKLEDGFA